jgi:hypothetical protein
METSDLLLAVQVRQLAADLRNAARSAYYTEIYEGCDEPARALALAKWDEKHQLSSFVPVALQEVRHVSLQILALRAAW